jgi:protein-S-isoprenylcysteine O-methyltransferase Ste14
MPGSLTTRDYALVRQPLYLSKIVALAGVALQYWSVWALLLWGLVCVFQLQRITYEERVLSEVFPEYGG